MLKDQDFTNTDFQVQSNAIYELIADSIDIDGEDMLAAAIKDLERMDGFIAPDLAAEAFAATDEFADLGGSDEMLAAAIEDLERIYGRPGAEYGYLNMFDGSGGYGDDDIPDEMLAAAIEDLDRLEAADPLGAQSTRLSRDIGLKIDAARRPDHCPIDEAVAGTTELRLLANLFETSPHAEASATREALRRMQQTARARLDAASSASSDQAAIEADRVADLDLEAKLSPEAYTLIALPEPPAGHPRMMGITTQDRGTVRSRYSAGMRRRFEPELRAPRMGATGEA